MDRSKSANEAGGRSREEGRGEDLLSSTRSAGRRHAGSIGIQPLRLAAVPEKKIRVPARSSLKVRDGVGRSALPRSFRPGDPNFGAIPENRPGSAEPHPWASCDLTSVRGHGLAVVADGEEP